MEKLLSTNPGTGEVTLNHEAIPGFMDAMTMPYKLKDPSILSELHPGDTITADVLVSQNPDADVLLDHIVVVAQGKPDYKPAVFYHVPAPGDAVPDFKLRNQDGRQSISISFAARRCCSLLFTRVARCPTSARWLRVTSPSSIGNWPPIPRSTPKRICFASAFDPEHDTPARLRAYGAEYIGSDEKNAFAHWDFAVPTKPELLEMAKYFDVGITHGADDSITHTLSTTLIGPNGKVISFIPATSGRRSR